MAREIDIAISCKDNMSDALKKISTIGRSFGNDITQLQNKLDAFNKNKYSLNMDLSKAKKELSDAKKQFDKLGDALSEQKYKDAQINYDNTKENLKAVSRAASQTTKDMEKLTSQMSKTDNKASTRIFGRDISKLGEQMSKAGITKMIGDSVANVSSAMISSAFGDEAGNVINSTISGIASGAAMGSIIPGIGTAVGAAVGGAVGLVNGSMQKFQSDDATFKNVVKSEYERINQSETDSLSKGIDTYGSRETLKIAFETKLGKDGAESLLGDVKEFANATHFEYDALAQSANQLLSFGVAQDDVIGKMKQLGDLSQGQSDIYNRISYAYGKMNAKQKVSLEELNMMTEAGVPILAELAKGYNTTTEAIYDMISKGKVGIEDINKAMESMTTGDGAYAGMTEKMSNTFEGLKSTLSSLQSDVDAAMGEGYNKVRSEGVKKQIEFLQGESGDMMREYYELIGGFKADMENTRDEILRETIKSTMESPEFQSADVNEKRKMMYEAQVKAEIEYKKTDGYQLLEQSEVEIVEMLGTALADDWELYGRNMQIAFNKGRMSVKWGVGNEMPNTGSIEDNPTKGKIGSLAIWDDIFGTGNAFGLTRVPYDNYPALLHEGERVLTKSQAQNYGNSPNININLNGVTVREESDIDKIASLLVTKIKEAKAGYVG